MLTILKDNDPLAQAIDLETAKQAIEDDAVIVWDRCEDPNQPRVAFPGLDWSEKTAWLAIGDGGVEYQIITAGADNE